MTRDLDQHYKRNEPDWEAIAEQQEENELCQENEDRVDNLAEMLWPVLDEFGPRSIIMMCLEYAEMQSEHLIEPDVTEEEIAKIREVFGYV